ncbi:MAG: GNAT family N-acetyltransferase [Lautropia sp.]|nr:GNAT family N-acetyltransferase [Lautropia sp.]
MKHEPWSLDASLPGAVTKNGIEWVTLPFHELDTAVLYRVLALRSSIFVVEQECLYQDIDGLDQQSLVVVGLRPWSASEDDRVTWFDVVATARILQPGVGFDDPSIGRMCVAQPFRQRGLGRTLLQHTLQAAREAFPHRPIRISAQAHLVHFYRSAGFLPVSDPYLEDGIPHLEMLLAPEKDTPFIA